MEKRICSDEQEARNASHVQYQCSSNADLPAAMEHPFQSA